MNNSPNGPNVFTWKHQGENTEKKEKLKEFLLNSEFIDSLKNPSTCERFGVKFQISFFKEAYRDRFLNILQENITTYKEFKTKEKAKLLSLWGGG